MEGKTHMKIVLLGEGRVGKTSLALKYVDDKFDEDQKSTVNASYLEKEVTVGGEPKQIAIWDTAGQEKFQVLAPIYYRDAEGAVLVYDITFRESFEKVIIPQLAGFYIYLKVTKWMTELRNHAKEGIIVAIAGNKSDKELLRQVDKAEAEKFAEENGVRHFLTSAKTGKGLDEIFQYLTEEIYQKYSTSKRRLTKRVLLVEDEKKKPKKKPADTGCC